MGILSTRAKVAKRDGFNAQKGKDICLMVWAAIWWKYGKVHKSDMVILGRDWASKKMGYTANSYLDVLDDQLPRIYEPGLIFMQDNAPIHTAKKVKDWFEEAAIPLLDWAPVRWAPGHMGIVGNEARQARHSG